MKSDAGALSGFALTSDASASISRSTAAPRAGSVNSGDDHFARLMRQSEARTKEARSNEACLNEARAREAELSETRAQMPSEEARTDDVRRGARESGRPSTRCADDVVNERIDHRDARTTDRENETPTETTATTERHPAQVIARDDGNAPLPLDWPPLGMVLPALLGDAGAPANPATGGFVSGDVLLGEATVLPDALRWMRANSALALTGAEAALSAEPGVGTSNAAGPSPAASNHSIANANSRLSTHTLPPDTTAFVLPAGMVMFKDTLDLLSTGKREDATPLAALLASPLAQTTGADLGLARTATVNPLTSLTPDMNTDQFGETLGTQLSFMTHQKISHATIRISPHELGTIEINLRLEGDRVHADFSSPQTDVRQALEHSLPKLRDLLGQQGFQLAHADVGDRPPQSQSPPAQAFATRSGQGNDADGPFDTPTDLPAVRVIPGLLDAYA